MAKAMASAAACTKSVTRESAVAGIRERIMAARVDSPRAPRARLVSVMPSCTPETAREPHGDQREFSRGEEAIERDQRENANEANGKHK